MGGVPPLSRVCFAVALLGCALLLSSCVEVRREVLPEVTPGEVPEEFQGARWPGFPVEYCIVPDEAGFVATERLEELVGDAFAQWGMEVRYGGRCDGIEAGNGRNEVTWDSGRAMPSVTGETGVFAAGFTRQLFRACRGGACPGGAASQIVEADILLSLDTPERFQTEECLFSTLLHETGHFLGVPHLGAPAVMAPATSECPQELTEADRDALAVLYEPGEG